MVTTTLKNSVLNNDIFDDLTGIQVSVKDYENEYYSYVKDNKIIIDWKNWQKSPMEHLVKGETETFDIQYTLSHVDGGSDTATLSLTVTGEDDPIANPDTFIMTVGQSQLIDVLSNDIALDEHSNLRVVAAEIASGYYWNDYGNVSVVNNQVFYNADSKYLLNFARDNNSSTITTIRYDLVDENGGYSSSTIDVTIKPFETTQIVADDAVSVSENDFVTLDVLANDTRDDSLTLEIDNIQLSIVNPQ